VTRIVDRGAIVAAWVGVGMAVTIGVSFVLVIPIEPVFWYLAIPSGLMIGYYANARSERSAGPWRRIVANGLLAGFVTGLAFAALLLVVKALFFYADNGYRDPGLGAPLDCATGPGCVYERYLADGRGDALADAGVTDADSFTAFYWGQQASTAAVLIGYAFAGSLGGALIYGAVRPKPARPGTDGAQGSPA
jgi:hypothetical protein